MGHYIMYNGYNSPNQYLANYKDKFYDKRWGGSLKTDVTNCGMDGECKGRTLKFHKDDAFKNINKILKNGFPSENAGDGIYKKENYFQETDFLCKDNLENSFFSYPLMCNGQPCPRYNYIINNRTGSANLLKNLYENNNITQDTTINTQELIIPAANAGEVVGVISYNDAGQELSYAPKKGKSTQLTIIGGQYCDNLASKFNITITGKSMKLGESNSTLSVTTELNQNKLSHTLNIILDNIKPYLEYVCGEEATGDPEEWLKVPPQDETKLSRWNVAWGEIGKIRFVDGKGGMIPFWTLAKEVEKLIEGDQGTNWRENMAKLDGVALRVLQKKILGWYFDIINDNKILLLNVEFKNYLPAALSGFNNTYLLDNLFDTDITCKSITLPAGGECQTRHIHTKDYNYITENHPDLVNICATQTGFALENITVENITMQNITKNKFYAKLFLGTFGMLILYMLYRIDKKRKN